MPGQNIAAGEAPHPRGRMHMLHHAMRSGNELYAGCWFSGASIIDVSDITRPQTLSHYEYDPRCAEPTHTFLKVPFLIGGRSIAVSTEEERGNRGPDTGKPHAPLRTWDVTDPRRPKILCTYHLDEAAQPYHGDAVRFGTHQLREIVDRDCMLYVTWFAAGLRMIDISEARAHTIWAWSFRRGRLLIVSPDSLGAACPLSGRNSTYRPVQIFAAGSPAPTRVAAAQSTAKFNGDIVRLGLNYKL